MKNVISVPEPKVPRAKSREPRAKSQEQRRKDRRAEQPKSDRGDDGQHEQRRENGLSSEIHDDRSVHAFDGGQVEIVRSEIRAQ